MKIFANRSLNRSLSAKSNFLEQLLEVHLKKESKTTQPQQPKLGKKTPLEIKKALLNQLTKINL